MSKLIPITEHVRKRIKMGFADGVDEQSYRDLPALVARIDELERALAPFIRVANQPTDNPLVYVYHKDCVAAALVMIPQVVEQPQEMLA